MTAPAAVKHSALEARALRWHHAGRWIVNGVDFMVHSGEIVGLLGPNGAGKTVTLCDRAYVLFRGSILAEGNSHDLVANPAVREHFLGETFEFVDSA